MIIGVDFDGTIVDHAYPDIGDPVPNAIETMSDLIDRGDRLILWTMRSGKELDAAVSYLYGEKIILFGINKNPQQSSWTQSPKAYCALYIDDAALGCPLTKKIGKRPSVDWTKVRDILGLDA